MAPRGRHPPVPPTDGHSSQPLAILPHGTRHDPRSAARSRNHRTKAEPPAAPDSDLTPQELTRAAERAYAAADWPNAEIHLASLVQTYHATPELAETVRRARASGSPPGFE
jgi:hypothetical protein